MKEDRTFFTDHLTLSGRLLFILSVLIFATGFYNRFCNTADNGTSFPLFIVLAPPVTISIFCFFGGAWILERCGIQIYIKKTATDDPPGVVDKIESSSEVDAPEIDKSSN
ncbi:hypothetical protein JIN85_17535 [Luteolibacter pohnpeiensis]|uniref:Uncharacterized protein n=1 Tax=Luteolibacter pohnpeiensis TaxID=454153 RepID=A0A934VSE9_9BACT|nr:hypothetical protein [Luteolibacter pohnpeiensis]MBK1884226.1 hypothetical protein [Luteolibacter pohnpeiensis]